MALFDELLDAEADAQAEKDELSFTRHALNLARSELVRLQEIDRLVDRFDARNLVVPSWTREAKGKKGKKAIATLQLSDTHFEEIIKNRQILGYNHYDRHIAEVRMRLLAENTLKVAFDYMAGVEYEGMAILATGDVFSGDIHEELRTTNEGTLFEGCAYWVPRMVAFLKMMADAFGKVHVAAVVGNHGRMTLKPIYKNRPQSNIEWLYWHWVADHLAASGDTRITFDIAEGLSANATIYTTTYALEHGDEFKGGSGISGARSPLMLGQHRTAVQRLAMEQPLDWMVVGHFHQYQPPSAGLIMGGSLKGYDEYAAGKHFRPEPPQQGFWITSPEHGPTISAPIFCQDRKAEGW